MQLKFNDEFTEIIPEFKISTIKIIPFFMKKFIQNKLINKKEKFYTYHYYVFHKINSIILLYHLSCQESIKDLTILNIYYLGENGLEELISNKYYTYKYLHETFTLNNNFDLTNYKGYLYPNNLEILKELPIYRYLPLWNIKSYYVNNRITIGSITLYPKYYPEFEYLIKMKLYNLAHTIPYKFTRKNFKENFGIDKSYYKLMQELDITQEELEILKINSKLNKEEIKFFAKSPLITKKLEKEINLKDLYKYFKNHNLDNNYLYDYYAYLNLCIFFKLDLNNKQIIFPKNLEHSYSSLDLKQEMIKNKNINSKIRALSNILNINKYEDENYIIYPASSLKEIIEESNKMHNCLRDYSELYSENESQIYFMRLKNNLNKSYVDIEVKDNNIVQAYMKFNKPITDEIKEILNKWEKRLIPIYNK